MSHTTPEGWILILGFVALTALIARPMGAWLFAIYEGRPTFASYALGPVERLLYRAGGVDPAREQNWRGYAVAMLLFNIFGIVLLFALQRLQAWLPLNPQGFPAVPTPVAFNTAVSFVTNTNWQSYGGETTMGHLVQMLGLTVQNFVSSATGIAVAFALIRGFARKETAKIGNFWADLTRITLYILLPACIIYALVLVFTGVPQTLAGSVVATTMEGAEQIIALGPVASQEAIKMLGTNGGGFFNANSAHPFENPTQFSNLLQMLSIFALGAGLTWTFGKAVGNTKQGWAILAAMLVLFTAGVSTAYIAESAGNPIHHAAGVDPAGGNMEGKETRFGVAATALFAAITTAASCGAVNGMHDSFTPIGGLIPLFNMQLGEVVVGGVGAGLYGVLLYCILAIFVAGLMVGRTPEYVGKKIESREVKLAIIAIAVLPLCMLGFTALASVLPQGLEGLLNQGPHGFSEMLYAYTSAAANNGSAFGGLTASNPFWASTLGVAMFIGRFFIIIPVLAIAGSLAAKKQVPAGPGSFPTTGPLWIGLLAGLILILGGLTFLPALALGPAADHLAMIHGQLF
ncbi:potassium-transporting ATPase subunit KdpA [Sphingosinicella sp. LHD-64]|uniref:potassium-transporting ATPase subunit KdpA n=1 Tax=Sphingosinicella sp. LHD-64 TaxID=3072139 RepID=UPI00280FDADB|nr:potassium-transporting ATPase subunit KdpA [Sphingosinicella sp. LHD-64]MDQ8756934.1 potassium-transporting ATPase subunit KdpA [Sphingosinicella sp. LHD-64]